MIGIYHFKIILLIFWAFNRLNLQNQPAYQFYNIYQPSISHIYKQL